jgi:hypothetical protein
MRIIDDQIAVWVFYNDFAGIVLAKSMTLGLEGRYTAKLNPKTWPWYDGQSQIAFTLRAH